MRPSLVVDHARSPDQCTPGACLTLALLDGESPYQTSRTVERATVLDRLVQGSATGIPGEDAQPYAAVVEAGQDDVGGSVLRAEYADVLDGEGIVGPQGLERCAKLWAIVDDESAIGALFEDVIAQGIEESVLARCVDSVAADADQTDERQGRLPRIEPIGTGRAEIARS